MGEGQPLSATSPETFTMEIFQSRIITSKLLED